MTDSTSISVTSKNVGAKPRLSLLSSKQSRVRLKSEDYPADQDGNRACESGLRCNGLLDTKDDEIIMTTTNTTTATNSNNTTPAPLQFATQVIIPSNDVQATPFTTEANSIATSNPKQPLPSQSGPQQQRAPDKLNVSKEDLIALLSMLKSDLQSKEIALASMKLEQLKRLINPVEISRSSLARTYMELQDRLKAKDQLRDGNGKQKRSSNSTNSSASDEMINGKKQSINCNHQGSNNNNDDEYDESDQETIETLSTLLELLDRHPLLALPRDSIYCLDYNCNEVSTKNYLNLKIQHLENLIDQHRKFRYHIRERLKRSEQRSLDLALKLELERKFRLDNERSVYKNNGKAILLGHMDRLKEDLEKEKASKHAIVMTLLNELLDERERNETLSERVIELERRLAVATRTQPQVTTPPVTNQQSVCKPRVPAKPAQLLDRQLSQPKNK